MVFRKIFKGKRFRSRKEKIKEATSFGGCDVSSLGGSLSSRCDLKAPTRYEPAVVETVTTADDQDDDSHGSDAELETLSAIYMFPAAWKERTGSRCNGAHGTIDLEQTRNRRKIGTNDDDSMEEMMLGYDDDDHAWNFDVAVNEERYRADPGFSAWMTTSLSCLTCV
mmetsp:Transcript_1295/g.3294  ORF Transcript_1295/g.3294 Transcript_1295/m.3294 type:complete len:167 (+) Transcript_1295:43-543(+)